MSKISELNLGINGMHCAGCAAGIEKQLTKIEGIDKVEVNYALGTARVTYYDDKVSKDQIAGKIKEYGYIPKLPGESLKTNLVADSESNSIRKSFILSLTLLIPVIILSLDGMLWGEPLLPFGLKGIFLLIFTAIIMFRAGRSIFADALNQTKHFAANMNSLIAIGSLAAFIYSIYILIDSLFINRLNTDHFYFETSAMIITLILLGRFLEDRAKGKAKNAIASLKDLRPDTARVLIDGEETEIEISNLTAGMIVSVRAGEKIAADGQIIEGNASIDEAMITGESIPVEKTVGDNIFGGSVNGNSSFKFKVTNAGENSFLAEVIRLVEQAQSRKAPVQRLADKIAGIFVPIVLTLAIITFGLWYLFDPESMMLLKAPIAVLIIACPCALGLATPTAIMAGTARAARLGIYIRGGDILENATHADHILFDKTGTLTSGEFEVTAVKTIENISENKLIRITASVEADSLHPLAQAIVKMAKNLEIELEKTTNSIEIPGFGIKSEVNGKAVLIGNEKTMRREAIDLGALAGSADKEMESGKTIVYVALENHLIGYLALSDSPKDDAATVIKELKNDNRTLVMLTGDNYKSAKGMATQLGLSRFEAGIKPDQKKMIVETLRRAGHRIMMVGDGINDAPALAAADIGVALGAGTDVALESADIILMSNDLSSLLEMLKISRATLKTIKQNLFWAFFYNMVSIPLAAGLFYPLFGWALSPVVAAGTMAVSSLIVVSNSLRLLKIRKIPD